MVNRKKKWYQTGEFEDGYQFGDIFRTVKNSIGEKSEEKNRTKIIEQKSGSTGVAPFGAVENGKLTFDTSAHLYGFEDEDERQKYIKDNPEL